MRIVIIQGHPDPNGRHLGHALADAYAEGAESAGHAVTRIAVAELDFPLLQSQRDWYDTPTPEAISAAQHAVADADHLVLFYPLWLGTLPARLKGFLEQLFRPGFAFAQDRPGAMGRPQLTGKSARVVVTMGMPALFYRAWFRAHSLKSLERNILRFVGIKPVRSTLFGMAENATDARRARWLETMRKLGRRGR